MDSHCHNMDYSDIRMDIFMTTRRMKKEQSSFGEYFDAQYDRLRKMLDNKDAQQQKEWLEEWTRKQNEKEDRKTQV